MPKRKRYAKPINGQGKISAFFAASLAVATDRVADDEPATKRQSGRGGGSSEERNTAASGSAETILRPFGGTERVTANKNDITKKVAKRKANFKRTSKHKVGWDPEWMDIPKYHWLVPVYGEANGEEVIGMLCSTCRRHNQSQHNGRMWWSKDPVVGMRKDCVNQHWKSDQHKAARRKEAARVAAAANGGILQAFQCQVSCNG
ncbi:uncharacterized protein [Branchiostoma lanceolatum]|uniref:uncharacterized protein n=1 Tax=Branchiostoma lanceolatum TaxID=7740 RepID=UPI0034538516